MKNRISPDYPVMYKMNFIRGRTVKFRSDDFLFSAFLSMRLEVIRNGSICWQKEKFPGIL